MSRKIAVFFALLVAGIQRESDAKPWLECRPSYFFFPNNPMKDIYSRGGVELQGSISAPCHHYLNVYGSIGYRKVHGKALNTGEKTKIMVLPIDIGLKPIFNFHECFYCFFAIGPRYFYFRQHNNSPYVNPLVKGSGIGFFINTGFEALMAEHFLWGVFGEYSYEKKTIRSQIPTVYSNGSVQMGGLAFGVSLGYAF